MSIGQEGREVHKTLQWQDHEKGHPEKVLQKFEQYVSPSKNKRVARFRFRNRKQKEGESFDSFLKDLRLLAMDCEFTDVDDLLIDAIIVGIQHTYQSTRTTPQRGPEARPHKVSPNCSSI